ncbi:MAG: hypothetical protein EON61_14405 [Alphaproteobacteria bacterium]|nr:MAG: hypothetical protein EON61_14405 [Alphaproteobacteria bacterium]
MTLINVVRIAKIVALLAFFLPWVAVSCQNVDVATASGIELMQGRMTENPHFEQQVKQQMNSAFGGLGDLNTDGASTEARSSQEVPELGVNFFAIAAAIVILIGLGLTFTAKGKTAGRNALITSLLGLALVFGTVWWFKDSAMRDMEAKEGGASSASSPFGGPGSMDAMGQQMLDNMLQERMGYWVALIALAVAAGAGGLAMAGTPSKPEQTPPAS